MKRLRDVEIRMPFRQNGDKQIIYKPRARDIVAALVLLGILFTSAGLAVDWYKGVQDTTKVVPKLVKKVNNMEILNRAEQEAQRVLVEALVRKIMPEEADTIIELSKTKKESMKKTLEEQNDKEEK